jgi:hypothetical protein
MNRGLKDDSFLETLTREYLRKGVKVRIPKEWNQHFSFLVLSCLKIDPKERPAWDKVIELLSKLNF